MLVATNTFLANGAILDIKPDPQDGSSLIRKLAPEIRAKIYEYALTDYPDPSRAHEFRCDIYWMRPSYTSGCKTDTALLSTCRAIYKECWFMPFFLTEYVEFLSENRFISVDYPIARNQGWKTRKAKRVLREVVRRGGQPQALEINNMHFFMQASYLDGGLAARRLRLAVPLMHPRTLTLTIRHCGWQDWPDKPLELGGRWIPSVCRLLPDTVSEIRLELETVECKAGQAKRIAAQMKNKWFFVRPDGIPLFAGRVEEGRWRGPSVWSNLGKPRYETVPGVVDYFVTVVRFQPKAVLEREGVSISQNARELSQQNTVCACKLNLETNVPKLDETGSHSITEPQPSPPVDPYWTQRLEEVSVEVPEDSQTGDDEGEAGCSCDKALLKFWPSGEKHHRLPLKFDMSSLGGILREIT